MKKIFIALLIFIFTLNTTNAWIGLFAQNGDLLNISKWNEMIADKLSISDLKAGTGVTLTNSGSEVYINSSAGTLTPYIATTLQLGMGSSTTKTINLDGYNFIPTSVLQIPGFDGTVNSTTVLSRVRLEANITSGPATADYDLVVSNGGVLNTDWSGNGVNLLHVGDILGTGIAGTYTENFEAGLGSWVDSRLTGSWRRDSGGTTSGGTGPNVGAGGSTWYMYTEVSSNAHLNDFGIETSDFRHATSIS